MALQQQQQQQQQQRKKLQRSRCDESCTAANCIAAGKKLRQTYSN
jgi:hypothetical protein